MDLRQRCYHLWSIKHVTVQHESKMLKILPYQPKVKQPTQTPITPKKMKGVNIISVKDLDQELKNDARLMVLAAREVIEIMIALSLQKSPS